LLSFLSLFEKLELPAADKLFHHRQFHFLARQWNRFIFIIPPKDGIRNEFECMPDTEAAP